MACRRGGSLALPVDQGNSLARPVDQEGSLALPVDQGGSLARPVDQGISLTVPVNQGESLQGDVRVGAKRERTEGTELESAASKSDGDPPLKRKWLLHRKKAIGRRKDGRKVKHGTYDYLGVRESHGLAPSAPPQQVLSAVMIDQGQRHCSRWRQAVATMGRTDHL